MIERGAVLSNTELELMLKSFLAHARVACSELDEIVRTGRYFTTEERAGLAMRVADTLQTPAADLVHQLLVDLKNDIDERNRRRAARGE